MGEINLRDSRGRDAQVSAESVNLPLEYRWIDEDEAQVSSRKILRSMLGRDGESLLEAYRGPSRLADAIIAGDPEVDVEHFGRYLSETSRAFLDPDGELVRHLSRYEVRYNLEGEEVSRKAKQWEEPNVAGEVPLTWTGRLVKKEEACRRFVFSGKMQLHHVNGLTYDFLHEMARELDEAGSLMILGSGKKGNGPLVFRRGGLNYRGFLEGRIQGERYALILHLSNMELKQPQSSGEG